jgi:hypothetical protein
MERGSQWSSHPPQGLVLSRTHLKSDCRWTVYVIRREDFLRVRFVLLENTVAPFCFIVAGDGLCLIPLNFFGLAMCSVLSIIIGYR